MWARCRVRVGLTRHDVVATAQISKPQSRGRGAIDRFEFAAIAVRD
jgi:hypothetical protein